MVELKKSKTWNDAILASKKKKLFKKIFDVYVSRDIFIFFFDIKKIK